MILQCFKARHIIIHIYQKLLVQFIVLKEKDIISLVAFQIIFIKSLFLNLSTEMYLQNFKRNLSKSLLGSGSIQEAQGLKL